jgi:dihydrofolate synthase/folylpolyglutamate synthase
LIPATLEQWLAYLEQLHPQAIALGLDRVERVRQALSIAPSYPIITVGGTNGKGSCCAMLEAMLLHAGYRVGCYTSPHLLRYNERVRVGGRSVDDAALCRAFERIERARGGVSLTYFEFGTLAAMLIFAEVGIDVGILEVGLGGRLDAVNIFDADCALVVSVDLDHQNYLGNTREAIGFEKAGIYRSARPAVCADSNPPESLVRHAQAIGADLLLIDRDFGYVEEPHQWRYWGPRVKRNGLPWPALRGRCQIANAAACITALDTLRDRLPLTAGDLRGGLLTAAVAGRFQVLPGRPLVVLDVAHNPHAARVLAANLAELPKSSGDVVAVCAMLRDKDIAGVVGTLKGAFTRWLVADSAGPRGARAAELAAALAQSGVGVPVAQYSSVAMAWREACKNAGDNDKIIVFGSFLTVAAVMRELALEQQGNRTG